LLVGACVIDSGYDGEVFVNLHNVGRDPQFIERGMKIAQIVMVPVIHFRALETPTDNLYEWYPISMSERGSGALGSTDKKGGQVHTFPTPKAPELNQSIDPFTLPREWELGDRLK